MRIKISHIFDKITSLDNLLGAWEEFEKGKKFRRDVLLFSQNFADNIFSLHSDLIYHTYIHGDYQHFKINDPKPRDIHKASVCDRLVHHAIYRILYPYFDKKFIYDSYSCRINKGTHKAINRFRDFGRIVSRNNTRTTWILKCDIRKFFASIDHKILKNILAKYIGDKDVLWLLGQIIDSFNTKDKVGIGLPLGNLTSQLLVNIYLNELDQFVKHRLRIKYYLRYADDFVILSDDKQDFKKYLPKIKAFLKDKLKLSLHSHKVYIKTLASGIDFLGYIVFPKYRLLRTKTKRRICQKLKLRVTEYKIGKISKKTLDQSLNSYLGVLSHADSYTLKQKLLNQFWFWMKE